MKHLLVLILISGHAWAQQQSCAERFASERNEETKANNIRVCEAEREYMRSQDGLRNNPNNTTGNNVPFTRCDQLKNRATPVAVPAATPPATIPGQFCRTDNQASCVTPVPTGSTALPTTEVPKLKTCRGFEVISANFGGDLESTDRKDSHDRKIFCIKKSGITADYESCTSALNMYNAIVVAEAAMQVFQGVQTSNTQNRIQNDVNQRAASGDAQNAAYDAQIASARSAQSLNQQQAMAYTAAVAALYSKIQSWIKETPEAVIQKGCGGGAAPRQPAANTPPPTTPAPIVYYANYDAIPRNNENCVAGAREATNVYGGFVFANRDAKGAFVTAAMMFAAKGILAGIKANQFGNLAKAVDQTKTSTEDPYNPATFARCDLTPNDPACLGPSVVTPGSGLQDGGFSFGDTFGNSGFTPVADAEDMTTSEPGPLAGDAVVPGTANPFADDAKVASGILDPAAAASLQPGGGAGGGGGGGAGSPGGGSASLGSDTPGMDDSKKESDIKANKAAGNYAMGGGAGFAAVKGMKEENPFANLFDGKGGGKLEEDRSIASGDIDGKDSGIFAKISKRYNQVQADKRIEAKNLEE